MATTTEPVDLVGDEVVRNLVRASLFAALMGAFAFVSFPNPLNPTVPVTLQVLGVFLAGIYLGPAWAAFSMVVYLFAGVLGAPVFSGASSGLGVLLGPTGGYLLSYPFAAALVGGVVHGLRDVRNPAAVHLPRLLGGMVAGTAVIYAFGIVQYWQVTETTLAGAVVGAAVVFVPVEALKIAAAVGIVRDDAVRAN